VLTKLVLSATPNGACKLIEVPFSWRQGDALPVDAFELKFPSPVEALKALAERGRKQNRIHVTKPERKASLPEKPPTPDSDEHYARHTT
jgi:hypothetical protein